MTNIFPRTATAEADDAVADALKCFVKRVATRILQDARDEDFQRAVPPTRRRLVVDAERVRRAVRKLPSTKRILQPHRRREQAISHEIAGRLDDDV
jgi:hypothetical protein